jgi:hypothetical protein
MQDRNRMVKERGTYCLMELDLVNCWVWSKRLECELCIITLKGIFNWKHKNRTQQWKTTVHCVTILTTQLFIFPFGL